MRSHAVARVFRAALLAAIPALFAWSAVAPGAAEAAPQLVRTLPSKTTLIVRENRTRPVVVVQFWVRSGTGDEDRTERGAAAVLAELPWEGNETYSKDDIGIMVAMEGGRYNSEVTPGSILYEMEVPARAFGKAVETMGAVVLNPSFDGKSVENAKSNARSRSRAALGHAALASMSLVRETLHPGNALGAPTAVPERELAAVTAPLVSRFHQHWVTGDNITVVVVGDVDPEEAAAKVTAALAGLSKERSPGRKRIEERAFGGTKVIGAVNPEGAGGSAVTIGFRAPARGTADALALDALLSLLADYGDARLQRRLTEGPFLGASAQRSFEVDGGTVALTVAAPPENFKDAESLLFSEVQRARYAPVEAGEFQHAMEVLIARDLVVQSDFAGVGRATAFTAMAGKVGADEVHEQRLRALKPEDLVAVARQYLDPKQAVVVYMAPKEYVDSLHLYEGLDARVQEKLKEATTAFGGGGGPVATVTSADERRRRVDAPLGAIPSTPRDAGRGRVTRSEIDGLRVLASEDHGAPIVTIGVYLLGSVRYENDLTNGITKLLRESMLTSGDPVEGGKAYRFSLPEIGRLAPYQDRDMWGYSLTVPASRWKDAAKRLGTMLGKPELDSVTVDATRLLVLDQQTQWLNDDVARRRQLLFTTKYQVSGYRLPLVGSRSSMVSLTVGEVNQFHRKFIVRPNVVVTVFGDVAAGDVEPALRAAFADIPAGPFKPGTVAKEGEFENFREKWELGQGSVCTVSLAFDGPPVTSTDVPTFYVVNSLFNNPNGWFKKFLTNENNSIRDVQAVVEQSIDECPIVATMTVDGPPAEEGAVKMLMGQFRSTAAIRLVGRNAIDLENAKRYAVGAAEMSILSNQARAFQNARAELFGLPPDYVVSLPTRLQAVTAEDVQRIAFTYFQYPDKGRRPYSICETRPGGW